MMEIAVFYTLATLVVVPAILVVSLRNVFHCALWLIVSLTAVGGIYAMLAADFLFAVQLLVYAGGVMVLLLFVVLLSGKPSDWVGRQVIENVWLAQMFAVFLVVAIATVIAAWPIVPVVAAATPSTAGLGALLLNDMLLPFEFVSLVLVAALVGAVYFSVKKEP